MHLGRMSLASESVLPRGLMVLGLQPEMDFDAKRERGVDVQVNDVETGLPVWAVTGLDVRVMDPEEAAKGFREEVKVKVRVMSATEPQLPPSQIKGMGPIVAFDGLLVTPYISTDRCTGNHNGRCRAELKYSLRATGLRAFKG